MKGWTVVAITSMSATELSAIRPANSPASGGEFNRPRVVTPGKPRVDPVWVLRNFQAQPLTTIPHLRDLSRGVSEQAKLSGPLTIVDDEMKTEWLRSADTAHSN
jgi:hypothetical protein